MLSSVFFNYIRNNSAQTVDFFTIRFALIVRLYENEKGHLPKKLRKKMVCCGGDVKIKPLNKYLYLYPPNAQVKCSGLRTGEMQIWGPPRPGPQTWLSQLLQLGESLNFSGICVLTCSLEVELTLLAVVTRIRGDSVVTNVTSVDDPQIVGPFPNFWLSLFPELSLISSK